MTIVVASDVTKIVISSVKSSFVEEIVAGSVDLDVGGSKVVFGTVVVISG